MGTVTVIEHPSPTSSEVMEDARNGIAIAEAGAQTCDLAVFAQGILNYGGAMQALYGAVQADPSPESARVESEMSDLREQFNAMTTKYRYSCQKK